MGASQRPGQLLGDVQVHFAKAGDTRYFAAAWQIGSVEEAKEAREKLLASGVLDRFSDKSVPKVVEVAEEVNR